MPIFIEGISIYHDLEGREVSDISTLTQGTIGREKWGCVYLLSVLCMCMCSRMCRYTCVQVYVETRGPLCLVFLKQGLSHRAWQLLSSLDWLASKPRGSSSSVFLELDYRYGHHTAQYVGGGDGSGVLQLAQIALY